MDGKHSGLVALSDKRFNLKHVDTHGDNLWGHIFPLPEYAGGGIRLLVRTNELSENFFNKIKHFERRRSGRKNLARDLEHPPAS